jgi:hypothetical protein
VLGLLHVVSPEWIFEVLGAGPGSAGDKEDSKASIMKRQKQTPLGSVSLHRLVSPEVAGGHAARARPRERAA